MPENLSRPRQPDQQQMSDPDALPDCATAQPPISVTNARTSPAPWWPSGRSARPGQRPAHGMQDACGARRSAHQVRRPISRRRLGSRRRRTGRRAGRRPGWLAWSEGDDLSRWLRRGDPFEPGGRAHWRVRPGGRPGTPGPRPSGGRARCRRGRTSRSSSMYAPSIRNGGTAVHHRGEARSMPSADVAHRSYSPAR